MPNALQIRMLIGLFVAAIIAGCWWYAAIKKPGVGILYWLGAIHTVQLGISATYLYGNMIHATLPFWEKVGATQALTGLCMAALYMAFVNWLVERP